MIARVNNTTEVVYQYASYKFESFNPVKWTHGVVEVTPNTLFNPQFLIMEE